MRLSEIALVCAPALVVTSQRLLLSNGTFNRNETFGRSISERDGRWPPSSDFVLSSIFEQVIAIGRSVAWQAVCRF
jgi:hypothetical protein